ncbi:glycosyltransferase [Thermoleptolyngbya sichuanensis XZ-Cy5]|uniref:glycosyltransferase n=1 Tax=Thermoleptolyngbya sichuanensis TaxID=2885951 RepID=UPI00240D1DB3|nr:glycosyltransferase [Thermoleptolyngbya sichuanensis]MDG2615070.1 glycosyltransferase [Thermoleptolyngbya sichuanensis XZ-Cy5]
MKILFLDQSGKPGGAELCLLDIAAPYRETCRVALFADGSFKTLLEQRQIPVQVLMQNGPQVRKESGLRQGLTSLARLTPLIGRVAKLARDYDLIYANTQKALVVGAIASFLSCRPLIYHLHDILSLDHFSRTNRRIATALANRAALVIANSQASRQALVDAGGRGDRTVVIYNGFQPAAYRQPCQDRTTLRRAWGLENSFLVGHFSRLSPWKGQHVLVEALAACPPQVAVVLVGEALFGEEDYAKQLQRQVEALGLSDRVRFLGFQSDVISLMHACDLVAHTSTAPEPFGRVVVEGMLCGRPVVAADAGGVRELIDPEKTGWLTSPGDAVALAAAIQQCFQQPEVGEARAIAAQSFASHRFHIDHVNAEIRAQLQRILAGME